MELIIKGPPSQGLLILQVLPTEFCFPPFDGGGGEAAAAKLPSDAEEDQSDQLELGDVEEEKAGAFFSLQKATYN